MPITQEEALLYLSCKSPVYYTGLSLWRGNPLYIKGVSVSMALITTELFSDRLRIWVALDELFTTDPNRVDLRATVDQ